MAAAKSPTGDQERALDDVLAKIDEALPKIHQKARDSAQGMTPTQGFSPSRIKRTRLAFQQMCDDPLLSDSREEVIEPQKSVVSQQPRPTAHINGSRKTV